MIYCCTRTVINRKYLANVERSLGSGLSTTVAQTWSHDHVSLSGCVTLTAWHVIGRLTCLADSLYATADITSLLNQAHVQYQVEGGSTVEKPAETQTSIRLASHLVRAPNFRYGGRELESPMRRELGALTKNGKILGVRSFYNIMEYKKRLPEETWTLETIGRQGSIQRTSWSQFRSWDYRENIHFTSRNFPTRKISPARKLSGLPICLLTQWNWITFWRAWKKNIHLRRGRKISVAAIISLFHLLYLSRNGWRIWATALSLFKVFLAAVLQEQSTRVVL